MEQATTYLELILQDNENLLNSLTGYNNKLVYLNSKIIDPKLLTKIQKTQDSKERSELYKQVSNEFSKKMNEDQKNELLASTGFVRAYATRIMIKLNPIIENIDLTDDEKDILNTQFEHIKTEPLPNYNICEAFVQSLNNILASQISASEAINKDKAKDEYVKSGELPSLDEE